MPAMTFGSSLVANLITNHVTGSSAYWNSHKEPLALSLCASAIVCWTVGHWFQKARARELIDVKTGEKVILRSNDSCFFIPVVWWGPILLAFGVLALVAQNQNW